MTPYEEMQNALTPILGSMRMCGASEEEIAAYRSGFAAGAMWRNNRLRWISVEEELPKINPNDSEWVYSDDVLVALKDGSIAVGRYERDNSTGEHYWMLYGVDKDLIVTHWTHLPQPPVLSKSGNTGKKGGEE